MSIFWQCPLDWEGFTKQSRCRIAGPNPLFWSTWKNEGKKSSQSNRCSAKIKFIIIILTIFQIAQAFNDAVRTERLKGPIVLSRDHHDVSGADSPFRETSNIYDGSAFTAGLCNFHVFMPNIAHKHTSMCSHSFIYVFLCRYGCAEFHRRRSPWSHLGCIT